MSDLLISERETHLNLVADDRNTWHVFTDDPVMIRRLDRISTATESTKEGKHYELEKGQVILRKKVVLSEEERARRSERAKKMQSYRKAAVLASSTNN